MCGSVVGLKRALEVLIQGNGGDEGRGVGVSDPTGLNCTQGSQ
jgi:hypothetical protein